MDIWNLILELVFGIISGVCIFMLKEQIKENKRLAREKDAAIKKAEEEQARREASLEEGVVCILRKHLMDEHETWTEKGYITPKALESGLLMYKAYKGLGGNGMIDHMEEEIQELPIRD